MNTLNTRVDLGAKWLDEVAPGWADRINTAALNIAHPENCILGQLDLPHVADEVHGESYPADLGFDSHDDDLRHGHYEQLDLLKVAWLDQIRIRHDGLI